MPHAPSDLDHITSIIAIHTAHRSSMLTNRPITPILDSRVNSLDRMVVLEYVGHSQKQKSVSNAVLVGSHHNTMWFQLGHTVIV
jgi:hypothetical protein